MKSARNRLIAGACVLVSAVALAGLTATARPAPSTAGLPAITLAGDSASTLAARKAAVDKALAAAADMFEGASAKVQAAVASYTAANAELPGAQLDLANADGSLIAASVQADQAKTDQQQAENDAATANSTVVDDEYKVTTQRAAISDLATSVYQGGAFLSIGSLLVSGSPGEVLDRFSEANEVSKHQQATLAAYLAGQKTAQLALVQATVAEHRATLARESAQAALAKSQAARVSAQKAEDAVNALVTQKRTALAVAVANKASTLAQEQALQRESDAVATQLAAAAAAERKAAGGGKTGSTGGTVTPSSSYYIMPVHGWKSSNFGMRYDPIYHRWQLHAGVDIAAPTGTQIHAARAGTVIRAGYDGGYGNYTCINNGLYKGQGMASCYAHQSKILVHVGQKVKLGQVIGLVGETGAATGPHLHFEVRINGKPVQPLNWLPKCFC